jgi:DNA gyrase/topoisomerase IV subunit A
MGKIAAGVKSINLKDNDYVVAGLVIGNDITDDIALFTYNGLGKRVKVNEFERQGRGGRGVSAYKLDPSDYIAAAALVSKDKNILISGQPNSVTIGVNEIPQQSRSAIGVQIINNSKIKAVASL